MQCVGVNTTAIVGVGGHYYGFTLTCRLVFAYKRNTRNLKNIISTTVVFSLSHGYIPAACVWIFIVALEKNPNEHLRIDKTINT